MNRWLKVKLKKRYSNGLKISAIVQTDQMMPRVYLLHALQREFSEQSVHYSNVVVELDRAEATATITINTAGLTVPETTAQLQNLGDQFWLLSVARELDDALLHLRLNETEIGLILFKATGDISRVRALDEFLESNQDHWLAREILLYWGRVLKRIDQTSRTLVTLIEPESCFTGSLAEICFASDRIYMCEGLFEGSNVEAAIALSPCNFGRYLNANGISRLVSRFWGNLIWLIRQNSI